MEQLELDLQTEFKIGDVARIVRRVVKEDGWYNNWAPSMDDYINDGKQYTIAGVHRIGIFFEELDFGWPAGALELVRRHDGTA